jgi:filamentous hemagglutinin family protein
MKLSRLKILICVFVSIDTFALPLAENVISGNGQFDRNSTQLNVQQNSDFLHIQYESFDISATESVNFLQPNSMSIVINEVLNSDPTQLAGQLSANGQLFLLAPGGLVIHDGATIEATSFFASTLGIESVSAQQIQLLAGNSQSSLTNNGTISVEGGGYLELLSNTIINNGTIENKAGDVALTIANNALVRFSDDFFALEVEQAALNGLIDNTGTISAVAGNVALKTLVRDQINELVINNQGDISATSVWQEGGDIYLGSNQGDIENHGLIESISTVNTSSQSHIQINSDRIANFGTIKNNAVGNGNAGSIELNAESMVVLLDESVIQANADQQGDGGNVKVFSPDSAIFRQGARIEAEAGFNLGNGGFVDVSGWQYIEINGRVSTLALNGENGEFLIDPYNVTISAGATSNDAFTTNTYTPSGSGATINVTELQNNLKNGNVTVVTSGGGAESGDISVSVGIDLDGTNGNTLSLIADGSIVLNGSIVDGTLGTADATNITLQALGGTITPGVNTVKSGGGSIELKTSGNVTVGTGGNLDLTKFDTEGGSLSVESTAGTLTLLSDIDLDGLNGSNLHLQADGDLNLDFNILDSVTASTDVVDIFLTTNSGAINVGVGKTVSSYGGNISSTWLTGNVDLGSAGDVEVSDFNVGAGLGTNSFEALVGNLTVSSAIDLDGTASSTLQLKAGGNLVLNQSIEDLATGSPDLTNIYLQSGSNTTMLDGVKIDSGGGILSLVSSASLSVGQLVSDGGAMFLFVGGSVTDAGDTGIYDIDTGGGTASFTVSGDIGGTSYASALEVVDSVFDFTFSNGNSNVYLDAGVSTAEIGISGIDYNGGNGLNFNLRSTNGADIRISGRIEDSDTGTSDTATFSLQTQTLNGNIIYDTVAAMISNGGNITLDAGADITIRETWSGGGDISITANNVLDAEGINVADLRTEGTGILGFNVSGDVGGTSTATSIEINYATVDYTATGTNQNFYYKMSGDKDVSIRNFDYNGTGTFNFNASRLGTGDALFEGAFADSVAGSDTATVYVESTGSTGNIIVKNGASIETNGGDITYITGLSDSNINVENGAAVNSSAGNIIFNSAGDINLTNINSAGNVTLSGINISDNGDSASDVILSGGVLSMFASGDVGGTAIGTALEIENAIIDYTASGSNQNLFIRAEGSQDINIRDVEYDGTTTFNFNGAHTGTGSFIFSGDFSDLDSSGDIATLTVNTSGVGSDIQVNSSADIRSRGGNISFTTNDVTSDIIIGGSAVVRTQGGNITYDAGGDIGLTYTRSDGGAINLTAQNIYDNGSTRSDLVADAGVVTINVSGNVGGTSSASALEVEGGIYNYTAAGSTQNLFLSGVGSNDLTLNNVDYNGTGTFNLGISNSGTGDIIVTGDLYDSDTASADTATFNLVTNSISSDITINDGATIRSGDNGGITLNSANDIYLTGIFGGSAGTSITAANDIINNGDITLDIQSTGDVLLDAGRHVANGDSISIMANTLNLNLGTGNQNIITEGTTALGNIEVDGANGAALSVIGLTELNVTGSIVDSVGSDDLIDLTLGTSSGFITLPNGGYTVPGSLTFLSGTEGIQDSIDERVSITADSLTSSGNNFLSNTGPVIFDLTVNDLDIRDDSGTVSFEINNSKSMRIIDLDGDGEFLLGKQFKLNINGDLAVPNTSINDVDDQLWIIADDIDDPDADNIITISDSGDAGNDFNLIVELTGANNVQINTEISNFDGTVAAGGTLTIDNKFSSGLDLSTDLNLDGSLINGDGDIVIKTLGMMNLSDSGLSTAGNLFLTADDIMDSDTEISLAAANVLLQLDGPTASLYTLNLAADSLDASLTGSNTGLIVQASQDLQIQDLNSDGSSLNITDGYAWIDVAGAISLDGTISISDSNADGTENGWMYIGYQGNAGFGVNGPLQMTIDGSLESGTPNALNMAGSQLLVRQTGVANNANILQFTDADIRVIGGDAVFDIANENADPTGFGTIAMSANSGITASNTAAESIFIQLDFTSLQLDGTLNIGAERDISFFGYNPVVSEIDEVPAEVAEQIDQVVADIINEALTDSAQSVSDDIQSETVAAVESSPNVNVALNEMFSGCQKSDAEDSRCKVKDEISRFLGRFLMGGSMPKTN